MEYCQYHPTTPATYKCKHCRKHTCDNCVNEGEIDGGHVERCFVCDGDVENLGGMYQAEPFWRRLPQILRYPMRVETLLFVLITSFITAMLDSMLLFGWYLIFTGILTKYCFKCLQESAEGRFTPPDIGGAYIDGFGILLKLIAIQLAFIGIAIVLVIFAHYIFIIAFVLIVLLSIPAMTINFALTESVSETLSIERNFFIIKSIGLPYALVLIIVTIMFSSVEILKQLVTSDYSMVTAGVQAALSTYYAMVLYHLLGYVLFCYQGKLGYIAKSELHNSDGRSDEDRILANIQVLVKEGLYDEALAVFRSAFKKYNTHKALHNQCLDFLIATKNIAVLDDFASVYFDFLVRTHSQDQLSFTYKKILQVNPKYTPKTANDRFLVAQACHAVGDAMTCVRLLNGIQKQFPDYPKLERALELMLEALRDLPNMKEKADAYELFLKRFKQQRKKQAQLNERKAQTGSVDKPAEDLSLADEPDEAAKDSAAPARRGPIAEPSPPDKPGDGITYEGGIDFK